MKKIPVKINLYDYKSINIDNFIAFGYANSDYTYTEPTKKMYDYLSSYHNGKKYMRVHNILTCHGRGDYFFRVEGKTYGNTRDHRDEREDSFQDVVVSRDKNGKLKYNWVIVDRVYDIMLEHGFIPIVETIFMPTVIRRKNTHLYIPEDYSEWRLVLKEFVTHLQNRYGKEEIEKWYFEVWNEPDGIPLWQEEDADLSSFFALYDYMVDGVLSINNKLKVGGPALRQLESGMYFLPKFLEHCSRGVNYATGKWGTRLDFISVHCKGGGVEHNSPSMDLYMFDSMEKFKNIIFKYSEYKDIEIFNDESDIVWSGDVGTDDLSWMNFRNTHYFPGFVCKMVDAYHERLIDKLGMNVTIVDSDNCHIQWEKSLFSGNRSQLTPLFEYPSTDLIKKPAFNAYVLLSKLRSKRAIPKCHVKEKYDYGFGFKYGVLPTFDDESIALMVWNFEDSVEEGGRDPLKFILDVENIPFKGEYKKVHYRIDKTHSSSYDCWKQMGKPKKPSIEQIKELRANENLEIYEPIKDISIDGKLVIEVDVPHHGISLIMFAPKNDNKPNRPVIIKQEEEIGANGNRQIFLKWKPAEEKDFLHYKLYRKEKEEEEYKLICDNINLNTAVYVDMDVEENIKYDYLVKTVNMSKVCSD